MIGVVHLSHLKVKIIDHLPVEGLESHSVGVISQVEVLFLVDDILEEFFLCFKTFFLLCLLFLQLLCVLALDELKDVGLLSSYRRSRNRIIGT